MLDRRRRHALVALVRGSVRRERRRRQVAGVVHEDEELLGMRQGQYSVYGFLASDEGDVVVIAAGEVVLFEDLAKAGAVHERQAAQVQDDVAYPIHLRS